MEGHVAFLDGRAGADDEPALFDLRPRAADVAWVDGDFQSVEGLFRRGWRQFFGGAPMAWRGGFRRGKPEVEDGVGGGIAGLDARFVFVDFNATPPPIAGGEYGGEQSLEFRAGDGVLVGFQRAPVRRRGEHGKRRALCYGRRSRRNRRRGGP